MGRSPNDSGNGPEKLRRWEWLLLILYFLYEPAKQLWNRVYGLRITSIPVILAGIAASFYVAIQGGHILRDEFAFPTYGWVPSSIAAWFAFFFYGFPLLWLGVISPLWRLGQAIHTRTDKLCKEYAKPFLEGTVSAVSVLPFSKTAWKPLLDENNRAFIVKAVAAVVYLSGFAAAGLAAWKVFSWVLAFLTGWVTFAGLGVPLGVALGFGAGAFVLVVLGSLTMQLIDHGRMAYIGIVASAAAAWAMPAKVFAWVGAYLPWAAVYPGKLAVFALAFVLLLAYGFPLVLRMFSSGFWPKVFQFVKPLAGKAYDENNKTYSYFIRHVLTAVATGFLVWGAATVFGAVGFGLYATIALAAVTAWCAYGLVFKATDWDGGLSLFGAATSAAAFYGAHLGYMHLAWPYGVWGSLVAGVVAALTVGFVLVPMALLAIRWVCFGVGNLGLSGPASLAFNRLNARYLASQKAVGEKVHAVYDKEDKSGYREQFLHLSNIATTFGAWYLASHAAVTLALGPVLHWVAVIGVPLLWYLFAGRVMLRTTRGVPFVSSLIGLGMALATGLTVFTLWSGGLAGAIMAAMSAGFAFASWVFLVFPLLFQVLRFVTEAWTVSWLGPVIGWVYDKVWWPVGWVGDHLKDAWEAVGRWLAPRLEWLTARFRKIGEAYSRLLRRIRGQA